jgi:XTP/dITP diphosphohydrolase
MEILLATQNQGKLRELQEYLGQTAQSIKLNLPLENLEVPEVGTTFQENAFLKAQAYYKKYKQPVLSDDSGLNIAALPNMLGLATSEFMKESSYQERCDKIIALLNETKSSDRSAYFICLLCFYFNDKEVYFFEGVLKGTIGHKIEGSNGFGYDPIFIPEGQGLTLAQDVNYKNSASHRSRAVQSFIKFIQHL